MEFIYMIFMTFLVSLLQIINFIIDKITQRKVKHRELEVQVEKAKKEFEQAFMTAMRQGNFDIKIKFPKQEKDQSEKSLKEQINEHFKME